MSIPFLPSSDTTSEAMDLIESKLKETVPGKFLVDLHSPYRIGGSSNPAITGKKLRWKAGPGPLLAMGMGMKGTLELHAHSGTTHVHLTMKSPPMMRPMMQAMTGLNTADEMTKTINRIKELSEQSS